MTKKQSKRKKAKKTTAKKDKSPQAMTSPKPDVPKGPSAPGGTLPDFERVAAQEEPQEESIGTKPVKGEHGGVRPGAGRPRGTDNLSRVNALPEKANEQLVPVLQTPFSLWATSTGVNEMRLSKEDAKKMALPVTQLLEYYFPGQIPEIVWCWLIFAGVVTQVMDPRLHLLKQMRDAKKSGKPVAQGQAPGPVSLKIHHTDRDVTVDEVERFATKTNE